VPSERPVHVGGFVEENGSNWMRFFSEDTFAIVPTHPLPVRSALRPST
jgi:hypothetical protein